MSKNEFKGIKMSKNEFKRVQKRVQNSTYINNTECKWVQMRTEKYK